tara:strand:- start:716 stop:1219 length:504 start_codon:yes stop_codon:yes gene_type:complete
MAKFASGKNSYAISDRSGFRYRYKDMRKEWNGLLVGKDEFERKHPQLGPFRKIHDPQSLKEARPSRVEPPVAILLGVKPFTSNNAGTNVITVTQLSHGRLNGVTVRFRKTAGFDGFTREVLENANGYSITVVDENTYSFTASSGTAISGNTRGGGNHATAGPVTLEN